MLSTQGRRQSAWCVRITQTGVYTVSLYISLWGNNLCIYIFDNLWAQMKVLLLVDTSYECVNKDGHHYTTQCISHTYRVWSDYWYFAASAQHEYHYIQCYQDGRNWGPVIGNNRALLGDHDDSDDVTPRWCMDWCLCKSFNHYLGNNRWLSAPTMAIASSVTGSLL